MPSNEANKRSSEEDYNIDSSSSNRSKVGDKAQKYADSEENPDHIQISNNQGSDASGLQAKSEIGGRFMFSPKDRN